MRGPGYIDREELELDKLNEEGKAEEPGEHLLRQIIENLASEKVSSDFLTAVRNNFLKVPGNSVPERVALELENEEECHDPSAGDGALPAVQSGPESRNSGKEPHDSPRGEGRPKQDGEYPTETVRGKGAQAADSTIEALKQPVADAVAVTSQNCFDEWPALVADGKPGIHFDDEDDWSFSNYIKGLIEDFIGVPVYWWPLSPRREAILHGLSRARWTCVRGGLQAGVISH